MKVTVFGAGAIGSHLAARLARARLAEVSVVARGAQLAAIQASGIEVETPAERFTARPRAEEDPAALGAQDAVLVTVKAPAVEAATRALGPLLGPETAVAFVLNGIPWWWEEPANPPLPLSLVLGGVVWSACTVTRPGHVQVRTATNRLLLGERSGPATERVRRLCTALAPSGMLGVAVDNIRAEVWTKLLNNLSNGPICLVTRRDMLESFRDPVLRQAAGLALGEAAAIAKALGHPVSSDTAQIALRSLSLAHKPSILQDLEAGRPLEFETLFEAPLRLARQAGVPTPTLDLLVALARAAVSRAPS